VTNTLQTLLDTLSAMPQVSNIAVTDNGGYCIMIALSLTINECEPVRLMTYEPKVANWPDLHPKVIDTYDCRAAYDAVKDVLRDAASDLRISYRIIAAPVIERAYTLINPAPHTVLEPNGAGLIELCDNGEYFKNV